MIMSRLGLLSECFLLRPSRIDHDDIKRTGKGDCSIVLMLCVWDR